MKPSASFPLSLPSRLNLKRTVVSPRPCCRRAGPKSLPLVRRSRKAGGRTSKSIQFVRPTFKFNCPNDHVRTRMSARSTLLRSSVQLTTSASTRNAPASTVIGLSPLVGRSTLKARHNATGVGLKRVKRDLSGTGGPLATAISSAQARARSNQRASGETNLFITLGGLRKAKAGIHRILRRRAAEGFKPRRHLPPDRCATDSLPLHG